MRQKPTEYRLVLLIVMAAVAALTGSRSARAQISVDASVDQKEIGTEEVVRFTIEVQGATFSDVQPPSPPGATGLRLVQRSPSTQQNIQIVNSEVRQSISFTWQYRPLEEGEAEISASFVRVADQRFRTEPISIAVVPQSQRPASGRRAGRPSLFPDLDEQPPEAPEISEEDVFIRASANQNTVYRNEQLIVEYELFFRHGVLLRSSRLADSWDTQGFWREDLEVQQQATMRTETHDGLRYNVVTLKRVALFPTRSGELEIEPLRIETEVSMPRSSNPFRSLLLQNSARFQPVTISSRSVSVKAVDVPDPTEDFGGAVGSFSMETSVSRTDVEAGEPVQFVVTLSGRGNIATLPQPRLQLPPLIEMFGPEVSESIQRSGSRVSGTKTFAYTLVPRSGGSHTIPAFSIDYFDPSSETFKQMSSRPVTISVSGSVQPATATLPESRFPANDISDVIPPEPSWKRQGGTVLHRNPWSYLGLLLPLVVLGFVYMRRKQIERIATDERYARSRRAHPAARRHLRRAEELLSEGDGRALYEEIARAVVGFVGDRCNIAPQGMTAPQLDERLLELGLTDEIISTLLDLIEECDRARFSPLPPDEDEMVDVIERAAGLIASIDEHVKKHGITR